MPGQKAKLHRAMNCLTSYSEKRDLVQRFRQISDWFLSFCDCAGAQPSMDDAKADQHSVDCPYRQRIEHERKPEDVV